MKWCGFGFDERKRFEQEIEAEQLALDFKLYKQEFGKEFTIDHLLKIYELKAKAMLTSAIIDFPELLFHQIGIYEKAYEVPGIGRSFEQLTETICDAIYSGRFDRKKEEK